MVLRKIPEYDENLSIVPAEDHTVLLFPLSGLNHETILLITRMVLLHHLLYNKPSPNRHITSQRFYVVLYCTIVKNYTVAHVFSS